MSSYRPRQVAQAVAIPAERLALLAGIDQAIGNGSSALEEPDNHKMKALMELVLESMIAD